MKKAGVVTFVVAFLISTVGIMLIWNLYVPTSVKARVSTARRPLPYKRLQTFPEIPADRIRPLYHFSLIPRGVADLADLRMRVMTDPILMAAFAGFDWEHARQITFPHDVDLYAMYRRGDVVRWTTKTIHIPAGTVAFSDGRMTVLARCGNLVAFNPQEPSEPIDPDILDTPELPAVPEFPIQLVSVLIPPVTDVPPADGFEPHAPPAEIVQSPVFVPVGGQPITTQTPAATPEPPTILLFGVGALVLVMRAKKHFL